MRHMCKLPDSSRKNTSRKSSFFCLFKKKINNLEGKLLSSSAARLLSGVKGGSGHFPGARDQQLHCYLIVKLCSSLYWCNANVYPLCGQINFLFVELQHLMVTKTGFREEKTFLFWGMGKGKWQILQVFLWYIFSRIRLSPDGEWGS